MGEEWNLYRATEEMKAEDKTPHVGFSPHGCVEVIREAIYADMFDYINLHCCFVGSYTARGNTNITATTNSDTTMITTTTTTKEGNISNVRLVKSEDMEIFVISPYNKWGRLYAPSVKFRDLTLPYMEPITYGLAWIWHHCKFDKEGAGPHTNFFGAARPSDLDQPILALFML